MIRVRIHTVGTAAHPLAAFASRIRVHILRPQNPAAPPTLRVRFPVSEREYGPRNHTAGGWQSARSGAVSARRGRGGVRDVAREGAYSEDAGGLAFVVPLLVARVVPRYP